jgi:hypothetical protein
MMNVEDRWMQFKTLNSGNKVIDTSFFILQLFEMYQLTDEQILKILEFCKPIKKEQ